MNRETNGTIIVRRMDNILQSMRQTRNDLCRELGMSKTTIANWLARGSIPAVTDCIRIADYLNVSVEWLVYGEDTHLSNDELAILDKWRMLTQEDREELLAIIDLKNKKIYDKTIQIG